VSRARLAAAAAAIALLGAPLTATRAVAAAVAPVEIPLTDLGYRDGVTVVGAAPSITFDLPRYASLEGATLVLLLHAAAEAAPSSTIEIAVNGRPVLRRTLGQIGTDPRLVVPLPLPAARAQTFVVSVTGALRVAGDPCASTARAGSCSGPRPAAPPRRSSATIAVRSTSSGRPTIPPSPPCHTASTGSNRGIASTRRSSRARGPVIAR
jgi:hypothetical protein